MVDYAFILPCDHNRTEIGLDYFWSGFNWICVFTRVAGTPMGVPAFIGQYWSPVISTTARAMCEMGWILTFVAFLLFWVSVHPNGNGCQMQGKLLRRRGL